MITGLEACRRHGVRRGRTDGHGPPAGRPRETGELHRLRGRGTHASPPRPDAGRRIPDGSRCAGVHRRGSPAPCEGGCHGTARRRRPARALLGAGAGRRAGGRDEEGNGHSRSVLAEVSAGVRSAAGRGETAVAEDRPSDAVVERDGLQRERRAGGDWLTAGSTTWRWRGRSSGQSGIWIRRAMTARSPRQRVSQRTARDLPTKPSMLAARRARHYPELKAAYEQGRPATSSLYAVPCTAGRLADVERQ